MCRRCGLDIPTVDLVLNYDIPRTARSTCIGSGGRLRAGRAGRAVAFVTQYDVELYQRRSHLLGIRLRKADVDEDRALAFLDRVTGASRTAQRQMNDDDAFKKRRKKRDVMTARSMREAPPQVRGAEEEEARFVEEAAEVISIVV